MFLTLWGVLLLGDHGTFWLCPVAVLRLWECNSSPDSTGPVFLLHALLSNPEVDFEWLWDLPPTELLVLPWHRSRVSRSSEFVPVVPHQ